MLMQSWIGQLIQIVDFVSKQQKLRVIRQTDPCPPILAE